MRNVKFMSPKTRETVERAAYAAVGAPVAALKALGARVSDLREMVESSRKELNGDVATEINQWIAEGERVIERGMERLRATGMVDELRSVVASTRKSAQVGVRKATRTIDETLDTIVPDTSLTRINGIGDNYETKLADVGVKGVADFLSATGTEEDVAKLAKVTGFSAGTIESWRDQVALSRVDGIGGAFQRLLRRVDVWTLRELSQADPELLTEQMATLDSPDVPDQMPSIYQVKQWIAEAKTLIKRS
jgi:predicted flap endonuclease-1-like 5' DNA nuclease